MAAALSLDLRELSKKGKTFPTISDKFATTTSSGRDGNTRDKPWTKIKMSLFLFSWKFFKIMWNFRTPKWERRKCQKLEPLNYSVQFKSLFVVIWHIKFNTALFYLTLLKCPKFGDEKIKDCDQNGDRVSKNYEICFICIRWLMCCFSEQWKIWDHLYVTVGLDFVWGLYMFHFNNITATSKWTSTITVTLPLSIYWGN